jgi:hypothetical protein
MRRTKSAGGLMAILVLAVASIGALVLLVALVDSGETPVPIPRRNPDNRAPLIVIEDKVITEFHLEVARDYHKLRAGKEGYLLPDNGILLQFMQQAVWEILLKKYGRPITPEDVEAERARMVRESKDRDTQRKIFSLLDQYPGMFEMIVVRASLANNAIYKLQSSDRTIQREPFEKAEAALKEALRDPDFFFRRQAEENPGNYRRVDSRKPGIGRDIPGNRAPEHVEQERTFVMEFVNRWLSRVPPGEVRPEVVDEGGSFQVLRLVERTSDYAVYESVSIPKVPYEPWFEGELKKLKGEVVDPATREMLKEKLKDQVFGRWLFGTSP